MIHYIGGKEDEDEWINKDSHRLRPPQHAGNSFTHKEIDKSSNFSDAPNQHKMIADAKVMGAEECGQRPHRKSRVSSDDARLAHALQEEEVRASRMRKLSSAPRKSAKHCPESGLVLCETLTTIDTPTAPRAQKRKSEEPTKKSNSMVKAKPERESVASDDKICRVEGGKEGKRAAGADHTLTCCDAGCYCSKVCK